jgi:hypothetical protein
MTGSVALPLHGEWLWPDRAVGPDAVVVRRQLVDAIDTKYSAAWSQRQWDLEAACSEAADSNWDGYGAEPVDPQAYRIARRFLEILPSTTLDPQFAIDPDGEVSISWRGRAEQVFSVSVGPNGRLSYAGIVGPVNVYGTEFFLEEVPPTIQAAIARVFPSGL